MIDQFEAMEAAAERWADENIVGENFICSCGQQCKIDDGVGASPSPFAPLICPDCAGATVNGGESRDAY